VPRDLRFLIAIAELKFRQDDLAEVRKALDEVWQSAKSGPYPLRQADACNVLVELTLAEGDTPAAIDAVTKAYRAPGATARQCLSLGFHQSESTSRRPRGARTRHAAV